MRMISWCICGSALPVTNSVTPSTSGCRRRAVSAFAPDPEIKRERIWNGPMLRPASLLVDRRGPLVRTKRDDGAWKTVSQHLPTFDSVMTQFAGPQNAPEMLTPREQIRSWRFSDHDRTDAEAGARLCGWPSSSTGTARILHRLIRVCGPARGHAPGATAGHPRGDSRLSAVRGCAPRSAARSGTRSGRDHRPSRATNARRRPRRSRRA